MPKHKHVTECLRGGPVSKYCSCPHCTLAVCSVCGAYEGALTTDCPGARMSFDRQKEVYETNLDYTDERGWHQGEPMKQRSPRFEFAPVSHDPVMLYENQTITKVAGCSCGWRTPQGVTDSDEAFSLHTAMARIGDGIARSLTCPDHQKAPQRHFALRQSATATDWATIDRTTDLKHELAERAVAWVLADRTCDDRMAALTRVEKEADAYLRGHKDPDACTEKLLEKLKYEQKAFQIADQRAQKCDEEFRQAARKLVEQLEKK